MENLSLAGKEEIGRRAYLSRRPRKSHQNRQKQKKEREWIRRGLRVQRRKN
jgi:hypothetical protein